MTNDRLALGLLLLAAVALRGGMLWWKSDQLLQDRDAYLGIARNIAAGDGFAMPGSPHATAYRPPLYPLLLSGLLAVGGGKTAIGVVHLALGTATVLLTWQLACRLSLREQEGGEARGTRYRDGGGTAAVERRSGRTAPPVTAYVAAGLVAVDPLLLQYTTLPMTETLFAFLVTWLLVLSVGGFGTETKWNEVLAGGVFALAALCRPAVWAFAGWAGVWWGVTHRAQWCKCVRWRLMLAAALLLSPWLIRNVVVLGRPVFTTTHGGYTLLLGNNPVFYREVVSQPWGTVWSGQSLRTWQNSVQEAMESTSPPVSSEWQRDRWLYRRAWQNIHRNPRRFVEACWLRFRRFWNVVPMGPAADALPRSVRWAIAGFYSAVTVSLIAGIWRVMKHRQRSQWMPLVLLLVSLTTVHLFYWSNMRMRTPLVPAIAVLASAAFMPGTRGRATH